MPRPGTPVIHPSMAGQIQVISASTMRDRCTITRGEATRTFDETTMAYSTTPGETVHTDLPCRVQPTPGRDHVVDAAGEPITLRRYEVTVPIGITDVQVDDRVIVTTAGDAGLVDRSLRVLEFGGGTYQGERRLICFDDLG